MCVFISNAIKDSQCHYLSVKYHLDWVKVAHGTCYFSQRLSRRANHDLMLINYYSTYFIATVGAGFCLNVKYQS